MASVRIKPTIDVVNLKRELAENRVTSLELVREALSNAKDHGATRVWIQTSRNQRNEVSVLITDDGEGMTMDGLAAFWGVGATVKPRDRKAIGYKGHGTKLYFRCERLSVATRNNSSWLLATAENPSRLRDEEIEAGELPSTHPLWDTVTRLGLRDHTGTAILIERIEADDASSLLLSRQAVESYCDWFTVVGDIRSGLFQTRKQFHDAVRAGGNSVDGLRLNDADLKPMRVFLKINGEKDYTPIGQGPSSRDREFLAAWHDDLAAYGDAPELLAFGHRFADEHESAGGVQRVRDDRTALRLTTSDNWVNEDGIAIVARVEGHRRQRETYLEARWQNHPGVYSFEERFGLWLCKDFVPVSQRNDLLKEALERASKDRLQFDLGSLRNWQIFINSQEFTLTANRNNISNERAIEKRFVDALVVVLERALKTQSFRDWVARLRTAKRDKRRDQEIQHMERRRQDVEEWINDRKRSDAIDPASLQELEHLDEDESLVMRAPESEQELFYLYGLLSARYRMPVQVLEYDTMEGVDAIARMRVPALIQPRNVHGRIEFKFEIAANFPIDHFFDAIDAIICWRVGKTGDIYEESSSGDTIGKLRKRKRSVLTPAWDTHEIAYDYGSGERVLPVLQLSALFKTT